MLPAAACSDTRAGPRIEGLNSIGGFMKTRMYRKAAGAALGLALMAASGCGGGVTGSAPLGDGSGADPTGGSAGDGVPPPSSGSGFAVRVVQDPPTTEAQTGDTFALEIVLAGEVSDPVYSWTATPFEGSAFSDSGGATTLLQLNQAGSVLVSLTVMDGITGMTAGDALAFNVNAAIAAPAGAALDVVPTPPLSPGSFVTLIALVGGPSPTELAWIPDPENPVSSLELQFLDQGTGVATLLVPPTLNFAVELRFTVIATYDNGGTLSREVTLIVL